MKELTIEQKAKAYDKAIAHVKILLKIIGNATLGNLVLKNEFEKIFPELKENENPNERIRKALIKLVTNYPSMDLFIEYDIHLDEVLVWVEKQGEQKPVLCEEDIEMIDYVASILNSNFNENDKFDDNKPCVGALVDRLKSLKERVWPKWEWSKEDERRINHIIAFMSDEERIKDTERMFPIEEDIRWLKSLRPQSQWKPSEEQLRELHCVISGCSFDTPILVELEGDLKKLMEE